MKFVIRRGTLGEAHMLARFIDQTNLRPTATEKEIKKFCLEAKKYGFYSVCLHPIYVKLAKKVLRGSPVKVITVIGFPLGATTTATKVFETKEAIKNGAQEIDMVINLGFLKSGQWQKVEKDIQAVVKAAAFCPVKVILETGYLNKKEIIRACRIIKQAGAKFVKTSTGFGPRGANLADIRLMRKTVGKNFGVKASGGIRTRQTALKMIQAGANRIGTSAGAKIVRES